MEEGSLVRRGHIFYSRIDCEGESDEEGREATFSDVYLVARLNPVIHKHIDTRLVASRRRAKYIYRDQPPLNRVFNLLL